LELVYTCHPDHSTLFKDNHGVLLIQIRALMNLQ
jgi:hypothetical protein